MAEVARKRTLTTAAEVARLLVEQLPSWVELPHRRQAALLLGQLMLETDNGHAMDNNNPGNITTPSERAPFFRPAWFTVNEQSSARMKELHELMLKGKAPRAFRAYETLTDGLRDYLHQLQKSFPTLLKASGTGDPTKFAEAIKSSRYTPDINPRAVARSLATLQEQYINEGLFNVFPLVAPASPASGSGSSSS